MAQSLPYHSHSFVLVRAVGDYTLVMEFYWPEKFNIYTYADSTPTNIVDEQNIKNFSNYQKLYLQFTK